MYLLGLINRHLKRTKMTESRFGRVAVGDPRFIGDLRGGGESRPATVARVCAYIAAEQGRARRCR